MKRFLPRRVKQLLFLFVLVFSFSANSQTTYDWLNTAPDGNFRQGAFGARWSPGGLFDEPPYGIVQFNNNSQTTMNNNVSGTWSQFKFNFGSFATSGRTIGGNTVQFFDFGGTWPFIQNQSTATHTINFPILVGTSGSFNLELIANAGNLVFGGTMGNQGKNVLVYGNNSAVDANNRYVRLGGIISGAGKLIVTNFGIAKLNASHSYTGNTEIDNGELWIESSGNIASGSSIFLGNGGLTNITTKIFLSKSDGSFDFTRSININPGNDGTRVIGGLNTSGTNTFSGSILRNSNQPLTLEVVNVAGTVAFTGDINGSGTVTKTGSGIATFSGTNKTYIGATTVSAGTLRVIKNSQQADITSSDINFTFASTTQAAGTYNFLPGQLAGSTSRTLTSNLVAGKTITFNYTTSSVVICDNVVLTSAAASASPICANATTTLTYAGLLGTGASVTWTANSNGTGATYGTGTPSSAVIPGTYYAYATGTCGSPVSLQVVVSGQSLPASAGSNGTLAICSTTTLTTGLLFGALTGSPATGGTWSPALSGAGTYTYTQTATSPCTVDNTAQVVVTVQAAPASAGSNGTLSICSTTTLTTGLLFGALTGSPATGGTWSPALSGAGTYTYTQTATAPCSVDNTAQVVVTVQAAPASAGSNGTLSICSTTTLTTGLLFGALTGSPATGGTWSPALAGAGTYTYTQTATAPCSVNNTAQVVVSVVTALTWYLDGDGDGYTPTSPTTVISCTQPASTAPAVYRLEGNITGFGVAFDCNDANIAVNPGATEICFNNIDDNCNGNKLDGLSCAPVVVNLTNAYPNNMVLGGLSTTIISTIPVVPGFPITGYIFEIRKVVGGVPTNVVVELPTVINKFNLTQTNIYAYDTEYDIRVRAIVNGEEQAYQGSVRRLKTPALASPVLLTSQCNVNLPSIGTVIFSQSVLSATDYEFTLTSSAFTMPATQVIVKQVNKFSLSMMQNYVPAYATDYYVTVRVKVGGAWSTGTTTACRITTPAVPTTQLVASQCSEGGSAIPSITSTLTANTIQYATQYTFKVAKAATPNIFVEKTTVNGNPLLQLNTLTGLAIEYDTTYRVWVKAVTATTSGTYPVNGCDVTTPETPSSSLVAGTGFVGNCEDGFEVASNATVITSTTYPGAKYHYIIKGYNGNVLIYDQFVNRSTNNNVSLSMFPTIPYAPGYTYYMSVALKFASGLVQPKEECEIILPVPPAREVVVEDTSNVKVQFSATAYPNPFANNFMIDVKTRNESAVSLKVYDMIGRLIEQRSVSVSNLATTPIGDNYPSGVYNVIVTQSEDVKTVRVVKR